MQVTGNQLLAAAGFALDQDRERRLGKLFNRLVQCLYLVAFP